MLDGIVYAGMVGIGFAFTENILYLAAAYNGTDGMGPGGVEELGVTFLIRCVASPFAHPLFTAFTGIGVGIAITSRSGAVRVLAPLLGYACAVVAHALWNGSTLLAGGAGFFGVYLLVMVPVFISLAALAIWARTREARILEGALNDAALRGLMPYGDIPHIVDLGARRRARQFARHARRPRRGWTRCGTTSRRPSSSAYLHHRFLRGTAPPNFAARGQDFVDRMQAVRPLIAFPAVARRGAPLMKMQTEEMLTALVQLRDVPPGGRAAARRARGEPSSEPPGPRWSTSSRTTSSRG